MKMLKNKKICFFHMSQGSFNPKIRFLHQKVCSLTHERTHRHTHMKVNTEDTLSGFQEFFLQPIFKDRPNNLKSIYHCIIKPWIAWKYYRKLHESIFVAQFGILWDIYLHDWYLHEAHWFFHSSLTHGLVCHLLQHLKYHKMNIISEGLLGKHTKHRKLLEVFGICL